MAGDLGRYERMAQRTKIRRAQARDAELTPAEQTAVEAVRWEQEERVARRDAGLPPNGCHECWVFVAHKLGGYGWVHRHVVGEFCFHDCHGPTDRWYPTIALAAT